MRKLALLLAAVLLTTACTRPAPPALAWQRISPLPTDADLHGLAVAPGLRLAVGEGGTILTSTDGRVWAAQTTDTTADLYGITPVPTGGFVAVGDGAILTSVDGARWTARTGAGGKLLRAVACGPQTCVAVGEKGAAVAGRPAGKWAPVDLGTTADLRSVAYAQGRFIAVGWQTAAYSSPDGKTWTPLQLALPEQPQGFQVWFEQVLFAGETWVLGGMGFGSVLFTSRDGEHWEVAQPGHINASRMASGPQGRLLRLVVREKQKSLSLLSPDLGSTWQQAENNLGFPPLDALQWDGAQYLAVGQNGTLMASVDGIAWEKRLPLGPKATFGVAEVAFGAGRFVAVANGDLLHSTDGERWEVQPRPPAGPNYMRSIAWGGDRFVATGLGLWTSPDGLTWTAHPAPTDWPIGPAIYGNGRFVAVKGQRTGTSVDGITWQWGPEGPYLNRIVPGDGQFVAFGGSMNGRETEVFTSPDGLTWTAQGPQPRIISMAYGKGVYVAFVGTGNAIISPDGRQWTEVPVKAHESYQVYFVGDQFIAMGDDTVLTSADGRKWTPAGRQLARHGVASIAAGNGAIVAVGGVGSILRLQR